MDKYDEYEKINEELEQTTRKIIQDMQKKSSMIEMVKYKEESLISESPNNASPDLSDDYESKLGQKSYKKEALTAPLRRTIEKLKDDCNKYVHQISQLKDERKQMIDDRRKLLKDMTKSMSEKQQLENTVSKLTLAIQQKNEEIFIMKKDIQSLMKRSKDTKQSSPVHIKDKRMSCNCAHVKDAEKELTKQGRHELATITMNTNNYNSALLSCLKLQSKIIDNLKRQIKVQDDLARVNLKDEELISATTLGSQSM